MSAALVTAVLSLVGVIFVHMRSERRIENRRRDDNRRNENLIQLRAVADYVSEVYSLNSHWRKRRLENTLKPSSGWDLYKQLHLEISDWHEYVLAVFAKTNALHLFIYDERLDGSVAALFEMSGAELRLAQRDWDELKSISIRLTNEPSFVESQEFHSLARSLRRRSKQDFLTKLESKVSELIRDSRIKFGLKSDAELMNFTRSVRRCEGPI